MTPEQQIREAFEEAYLRADMDQAYLEEQRDLHNAALDRLVAERDEARQDAEDSARLAYEANEHEKVLEGREAALREALTQIVSACCGFGPARAPVLVIARAALAGVPVDEGGGS